MSAPSDVEIRYSGGATTATQSLGGEMSVYMPRGQTFSGTPMAGVAFVDSVTGVGTGTITYTADGQTLTWTPANASVGEATPIVADGRYTLLDTNYGYILIDVIVLTLPAVDTVVEWTIENVENALFDNAPDTIIDYVAFYVYAVKAASNVTVKLIQPNGVAALAMGADPAGVDGTAVTVAEKATAPEGVTFDVIDVEIGTMAAGQFFPFWLRRTTEGRVGQVTGELQVVFD